MNNRFAFIGKQRAGKDTCAEYLKSKLGGRIIKFADPLYRMQEEIYKIAHLQHNSSTKDRLLLQFLGTEWARKTINPNLWVELMEDNLKWLNEHYNGNLYITDCRFPNELQLLEKYNFKIIQIHRSDELRIAAGASNLTHESETALDGHYFDNQITNNDTFLELYDHLNDIIIPEGSYCHGNMIQIGTKDNGFPIMNCPNLCPYWNKIDIPDNEHDNHPGMIAEGQTWIGECKLLGLNDDDLENEGQISLLWDQVKDCDINMGKML